VSVAQDIEEAGCGGWSCWDGEWSRAVGDFITGCTTDKCAQDMGGYPEAWRTAERVGRAKFGFVAYVDGAGWSAGTERKGARPVVWASAPTLPELLAVVGVAEDVAAERARLDALERAGQVSMFGGAS